MQGCAVAPPLSLLCGRILPKVKVEVPENSKYFGCNEGERELYPRPFSVLSLYPVHTMQL